MRKSFWGITVFMALVVFSAFTAKQNNNHIDPPTEGYFVFQGSALEQANPEEYVYSGQTLPAEACSDNEGMICTILAPIDHNESEEEGNWRPDFSVLGSPVNNINYPQTKKE